MKTFLRVLGGLFILAFGQMFISSASLGQTPLYLWSQRFGDASQQGANGIAVDASGNVIVTGGFSGTVDFGGGPLTGAWAMFVAKFDSDGNHSWSKRFGGASSCGVAVDGSGNVFVTGCFSGTVDFGGGPLVGIPRAGGNDDVFLVKFNSSGAHLWSRSFGDRQPQYGRRVVVDASGNVILAGGFWGRVNFGGRPLIAWDGYDIFLAKFDSSGAHLWSRRFGYDNWHGNFYCGRDAAGIAIDPTGDILLTGYFEQKLDLGGGPLVSAGMYDIFLAKFDPDGTHLWSQRYGDEVYQTGESVGVDALGNVFLTGLLRGAADFGGGRLVPAGYDVFLAKFDPSGSHLWSRLFGDEEFQTARRLAVDASGNVVLTGVFAGAVDFGGGPLVNTGDRDIFLASLNSSGAHLWSVQYSCDDPRYGSESEPPYATGLETDASGNVLLAGRFCQGGLDFGGGPLAHAGSTDIFLAKFAPPSPLLRVSLDVKPGSCPNTLNIEVFEKTSKNDNPKRGGVLPVAILGAGNFDVNDVDISTVLLEGVAPLRHENEDVSSPLENSEECECMTAGPDEYVDLTLKFQKSEIAAALGAVSKGDVIPLTLTGRLVNGTPFEATDCVTIVNGDLEGLEAFVSDDVALHPAVPNPFNPTTRISYYLLQDEYVVLSVYGVAGRLIEHLVSETQPAGEHVVEWNAGNLPSGIYFCRLEAAGVVETRKLLLLK